MALEDITDGAEDKHDKDRAERLGLESVDDLENVEAMQTQLENQRSLIISMDLRIEELEQTVNSMRSLIAELLEAYKDDNRPNDTTEVGEEEDKRDEENESSSQDGGGGESSWSIDL